MFQSSNLPTCFRYSWHIFILSIFGIPVIMRYCLALLLLLHVHIFANTHAHKRMHTITSSRRKRPTKTLLNFSVFIPSTFQFHFSYTHTNACPIYTVNELHKGDVPRCNHWFQAHESTSSQLLNNSL